MQNAESVHQSGKSCGKNTVKGLVITEEFFYLTGISFAGNYFCFRGNDHI